MKKIVDGDEMTISELQTMSVDDLKALAKANFIKLYTTRKDLMVNIIYEVWQGRLHKGDAFRN